MYGTKNYFAVIPASVRYDKRLKPLARLLYGEITALCNDKGYCWASNSYFAELYETTNETISRYISQLKEYGYIKIDYNKAEQNIEKRKIYIAQIQYCQNNQDGIDRTVKGVLTEKSRQYCQNNQDGIDRTVKQNNTENSTNNKTENNTASEKETPPPFDLFVKELCVVFESFTAKTATQLYQLDCFRTPQKQDELRIAFETRRYDWVSCLKLAKKTVESKSSQNLSTRWLDFISHLRIFLKNGDEKNHSIKRHYTAEELAELEIKLKQAELEKKQREAEEELKQKEIDKIEAEKLGMTLDEYYDYMEAEGKKALEQLETELQNTYWGDKIFNMFNDEE
ncbi:helix-turn-helix domain-containing protein [Brachyspira hyodysenteriae]|nr:helix-turn-helix domain-containing protein [Brachyspira hyodysenteriae]MDA0089606.1 helix-turn-helix domain-containing protein [Brachyspira hyodysenteriae]MDA0090584.1 helix-turn-helix domain-containing protein [Brachyspira hyodysenteriae]